MAPADRGGTGVSIVNSVLLSWAVLETLFIGDVIEEAAHTSRSKRRRWPFFLCWSGPCPCRLHHSPLIHYKHNSVGEIDDPRKPPPHRRTTHAVFTTLTANHRLRLLLCSSRPNPPLQHPSTVARGTGRYSGMARLTRLPPEVFAGITDHLPQRDLLSLLNTSKPAHILAEAALYRSVTLNRRDDFTKISCTLAARPHLCRAVRSFSAGAEAPWWSLDLLDSFASLREFNFEARGSDAEAERLYKIKAVARRTWMPPTLKRCVCFFSVLIRP